MFALIDCNNFYASCERVFNPMLNKKPLVILSNNDGCVISRSNEAKTLGIPMGAPAFKYQSLFKKNSVHIFSSNFPLYGDMGSRIMNILSSFTPNIEIYSIDEAFLKLKELPGPNFLLIKVEPCFDSSTGRVTHTPEEITERFMYAIA